MMAETREQQVLRIRTETIEYFHRLRRVEKLLPVPTDFNDIVVLQEFIHRLDTEREKEFAAESDSCPQPIGESANDDNGKGANRGQQSMRSEGISKRSSGSQRDESDAGTIHNQDDFPRGVHLSQGSGRVSDVVEKEFAGRQDNKVATLNELIAEIDRPFWRQAAFARLDELTAELADLRHDIERHVAALSVEVTESERLRQQLAEERKAREEAELDKDDPWPHIPVGTKFYALAPDRTVAGHWCSITIPHQPHDTCDGTAAGQENIDRTYATESQLVEHHVAMQRMFLHNEKTVCGGCKQEIFPGEIYRCYDCAEPFHRLCCKKHHSRIVAPVSPLLPGLERAAEICSDWPDEFIPKHTIAVVEKLVSAIRAEISRLTAGGTTEPIQSTTVPKDQK